MLFTVTNFSRYFHTNRDLDGGRYIKIGWGDTATDKFFVELFVRPYGQLKTYLIVQNIELPTAKSTTNLVLLRVIFSVRPTYSPIIRGF